MGTNRERRIGLGLAAFLATAALQFSSTEHAFGQPPLVASGAIRNPAMSQVVKREIYDPSTGQRWLLEYDPGHPGGPGRLVPAGSATAPAERHLIATRENQVQPDIDAQLPVIHSGDRVVVEEHTPLLDSRFEATALGPALAGGEFRARLDIGGAIVRVVAEGTGSASFAPGEARR